MTTIPRNKTKYQGPLKALSVYKGWMKTGLLERLQGTILWCNWWRLFFKALKKQQRQKQDNKQDINLTEWLNKRTLSPCASQEAINLSRTLIFPQSLASLRPIKLSFWALPPTKSISSPNTSLAKSASFFCFSWSSFGFGLISSRWLLICHTMQQTF